MKKIVKCHNCSKQANVIGMVKVNSPSKGWFYLCSYCNGLKNNYTTPNTQFKCKSTKHKTTVSIEFEASNRPIDSNLMYQYGYIPTKDRTVNIEWKSPIWCNLSGRLQEFRSIENTGVLVGQEAGSHINVGIDGLNSATMQLIRDNYFTLFNPLQLKMYDSLDSTTRIWGRSFVGYAHRFTEESQPTQHANFINVQHEEWLEFRLSKFVTAKQYFKLIQFCVECVKIIKVNYLQYASSSNTALKQHKAMIAGNKIVDKYCKMFNL